MKMDDAKDVYLARREQARDIWSAGVAAIDSSRLVQSAISVSGDSLKILEETFPLKKLRRVIVVGGGKGGAGMAAGFERAVPADFLTQRVTGWINIPEDCLPAHPLQRIQLHPARPAGVNEPTEAGCHGATQILDLVARAQPDDVCVVLISGGGSALLPAPETGIPLAEKLEMTRRLSRGGASIAQLNTVRRAISRIKGGGLARACRAGSLIGLIISDVIGDPLELIASGPTVPAPIDYRQALQILDAYLDPQACPAIRHFLKRRCEADPSTATTSDGPLPHLVNRILGSNALAIAAAAERARELGFQVTSLGSEQAGSARELGETLIATAVEMARQSPHARQCLLAGGETTVEINSRLPCGKGGRNQEVALSAIAALKVAGKDSDLKRQITLLAAGTDGEDGPTDAAGGFADFLAAQMAREQERSIHEALQQHDAYPFLKACQSLIVTGPTHTNVMDLNVVLIAPANDPPATT